jgi:hypothetical protein
MTRAEQRSDIARLADKSRRPRQRGPDTIAIFLYRLSDAFGQKKMLGSRDDATRRRASGRRAISMETHGFATGLQPQ